MDLGGLRFQTPKNNFSTVKKLVKCNQVQCELFKFKTPTFFPNMPSATGHHK